MKVATSYIEAWKAILKYRWPILFLYLANIIITFIVTSPFTVYFKNKMEPSTVLDDYRGFDISMILEFVNNYGEGLQPLGSLFIIVIVFYFIFTIYTNAAVLYAVLSQNNYVLLRPFWNGGLNYFWKILRLSIYYLIALATAAALVALLVYALGINLLDVSNDGELIRKIGIGVVIFIIFAVVFSMIKQYAKLQIAAKNEPFITSAILQGGRFVFTHFINTLLLYLLNILFLIIFLLLFFQIRKMVPINQWLITFVLAQVLLLAKIVIRITHLDSCFRLYLKLS